MRKDRFFGIKTQKENKPGWNTQPGLLNNYQTGIIDRKLIIEGV